MFRICWLFGTLLLLGLLVSVGSAQEATVEPLVVTELGLQSTNTAFFPTISATLTGEDSRGNGVANLLANEPSRLRLREDDRLIDDFDVETVPVGVDVTFVIDANRDIEWIDQIGDVSRLAKTRTSIANFGRIFLNRAGLDSVNIVVPTIADAAGAEPSEPTLLLTNGTTPDDVSEAIGTFTPEGQLSEQSPLNEMLLTAIDSFPSSNDEGRFRAIVLYSSALSFLNGEVDNDAIAELAAMRDVRIYLVILGKRADPEEIDASEPLFEPTGGSYIHMPEPEDATPLFETLGSHAEHLLVTYQSALADSVQHTLSLEADGVAVETGLSLNIAPPEVAITLPEMPIERYADDPSAPEELLVTADVSWPDEFTRRLADATLLVNGEEDASSATAVFDVTGRLTFQWPLTDLAAGDYELQVALEDELGLTARSAPFVQTLVTQRPATATPPPTVEPTATPEPALPTPEEITPLLERIVLPAGGLLGIGLVGAGIVLWRRRGGEEEAPPATPAQQSAVEFLATGSAKRTDKFPAYAALELLENGPDEVERILLKRDDISLGSAENEVDIQLTHKSVSNYHARLRYNHGVFLLYDEGSTDGTYVNRERLGLAPQIVHDGDQIDIGRVRMRLALTPPDAVPPEPEPEPASEEAPTTDATPEEMTTDDESEAL